MYLPPQSFWNSETLPEIIDVQQYLYSLVLYEHRAKMCFLATFAVQIDYVVGSRQELGEVYFPLLGLAYTLARQHTLPRKILIPSGEWKNVRHLEESLDGNSKLFYGADSIPPLQPTMYF